MQASPVILLQKALIRGDESALAAPLARLADSAVDDYATFQLAIEMLAFHDRLDLLAEMLRAAWPGVRAATGWRPAARDALAAQATDFTIFHFAAAAGDHVPVGTASPGAVASLRQQLESYFEIDADGLDRFLATLAGAGEERWQLTDFAPAEGPGHAGQAARRLAALLIVAVGELHRRDGVPYGRAALFREQLPSYLALRRAGQLWPRQPVEDLMRSRRALIPSSPAEASHPLWPDTATLPQYVDRLLHPARPQPYRAAALVSLLPAWRQFLARRGWMAPVATAGQPQALPNLDDVAADLKQRWYDFPDPALRQSLSPKQQSPG